MTTYEPIITFVSHGRIGICDHCGGKCEVIEMNGGGFFRICYPCDPIDGYWQPCDAPTAE